MTVSSLLIPVVLCGGSGTRLWPLSRRALPKQFATLVGGESLLALTLRRAARLAPRSMVVAADEHRFLVQEAARGANVPVSVLLEPVARNTAAAIAAACLSAPAGATLVFLPADHHIPDAAAFADAIRAGLSAAQTGEIVTLGITPSMPSSAYGYIQAGAAPAGAAPARRVQRFIEKPPADVAQRLLLEGGHYWNAGVFIARADAMLAALERHAPDILAACRAAEAASTIDGDFKRLGTEAFGAARSQSIDYAVMERHDRVAMVPFAGAWSDVGSWNAVAALAPADADGNRITGRGLCVGAHDTYVHAGERAVVALGTQGLLVVDTPDALLVADAAQAERVREVVDALAARGWPEATEHLHVSRPWGSFEQLATGPGYQVKRLVVKPGGRLSLQLHHQRAEHWVVVRGTARVTCGRRVFELGRNQSTYIPLGVRHRLENPGPGPLELIEVQSGDYLGEDDIVRFDDQYGRS